MLQAQLNQMQIRQTRLEETLPELERRVQQKRVDLEDITIEAELKFGRVAELKGQASSIEVDIERFKERRDKLAIETQSAIVAAEVARASLQNELGRLAENEARLTEQNEGLRRLKKARNSAEDELREARDQLINRQFVVQEPVSTMSKGAGTDEDAQPDNK